MSSAPVITSVIAIDSFSVNVIWSAPIDPNGIITGYTITYNNGEILNTIYYPFNGETVSTVINGILQCIAMYCYILDSVF